MAEALAKAEGEQDMEKKIEAALACPCLGALPRSAVVLCARWCFARRHGLLPSRFACAPVPAGGSEVHDAPGCPSRSRRFEGGALRPCVCACLRLLHPQVRRVCCVGLLPHRLVAVVLLPHAVLRCAAAVHDMRDTLTRRQSPFAVLLR